MAVIQGRTRSSDRPEESFPISQLKDAAGLARLLDRRGGRMRYDDLAAALGQQRNSGAFRGKTAAGQMFGLIETVSREASLTDLGRRVAAPDTEADALAEAFLHVPLYRALYGRYAADGGKLPMIRDIDVDIERLGVSPSRVTKARQVFLASAETAGYFRSGRDRLIRPSSANPGAAAGTILSGRGTLTTGGGGTPERKEPAQVSQAEAVQMPDTDAEPSGQAAGRRLSATPSSSASSG